MPVDGLGLTRVLVLPPVLSSGLFLLAADLHRRPTPAHPYPVPSVVLVCLSLCGVSVLLRAVSLPCFFEGALQLLMNRYW